MKARELVERFETFSTKLQEPEVRPKPSGFVEKSMMSPAHHANWLRNRKNANPKPVIDPSRKTGLTRDHPFVDCLVREVLKRLRPLVEDERRRVESQRAAIENASTRRRLNELERAASAFLRDYSAEDDTASESDRKEVSLRLKQRGFSLQPPYAQMIKGESIYFTFSVLQETFPEFDAGSAVSIECLSSDISADPKVCGMELIPEVEEGCG